MNNRRSSANLVGEIFFFCYSQALEFALFRFWLVTAFFSFLRPSMFKFRLELNIKISTGKPELPRQPGSSAFYDSELPQTAETPEGTSATEAESPVCIDSNANNFFQTLEWEGTEHGLSFFKEILISRFCRYCLKREWRAPDFYGSILRQTNLKIFSDLPIYNLLLHRKIK